MVFAATFCSFTHGVPLFDSVTTIRVLDESSIHVNESFVANTDNVTYLVANPNTGKIDTGRILIDPPSTDDIYVFKYYANKISLTLNNLFILDSYRSNAIPYKSRTQYNFISFYGSFIQNQLTLNTIYFYQIYNKIDQSLISLDNGQTYPSFSSIDLTSIGIESGNFSSLLSVYQARQTSLSTIYLKNCEMSSVLDIWDSDWVSLSIIVVNNSSITAISIPIITIYSVNTVLMNVVLITNPSSDGDNWIETSAIYIWNCNEVNIANVGFENVTIDLAESYYNDVLHLSNNNWVELSTISFKNVAVYNGFALSAWSNNDSFVLDNGFVFANSSVLRNESDSEDYGCKLNQFNWFDAYFRSDGTILHAACEYNYTCESYYIH